MPIKRQNTWWYSEAETQAIADAAELIGYEKARRVQRFRLGWKADIAKAKEILEQLLQGDSDTGGSE